jgi:primosomal protein N'
MGRAGVINTTRGGVLDPTTITVTSIGTEGRESKTMSEARRAAAVLRILQADKEDDPFETRPFVKNIWKEAQPLEWPAEWTKKDKTPVTTQDTNSQDNPQPQYKLPRLNKSQRLAVNTMLSPSDKGRLVIVQGPPGTGKTSVIGACVAFAMDLPDPQGLWLVAQSNVAVKNIAEKLISIGIDAWKLLVSRDFIHEW